MASFGEIGEREMIRRMLRAVRPSGRDGPGDDAALADISGRLAICSDGLTFERHMPETMTFEEFGWTVAAVNFSDLASMGARPNGLLVSLMMPDDVGEEEICDIMSGADQCAEFCGTFILGGDTKKGAGAAVATAIGSMEGRTPMTRYGATPGDLVAVTGALGGPAAGWHSLKNRLAIDEAENALKVPVPRVEEGIALASSGAVSSCIDLSDGLAEAAWSICGCSRVGMEFQREFVPEGEGVEEVSKSLGIPRDDMVLYWGGEYELMFTFRKDRIKELYASGSPFTIIGVVDNGVSPKMSEADKTEVLGHGIY